MTMHSRPGRRRSIGAAATLATAAIVVAGPFGAAAEPGPTSPDVTQLDITAPPGGEFFGRNTLVLSNGNYVVTDPGHDGAFFFDIGAVRLYDGATNALISTVVGSSPNDQIASGVVREVGDGNFIFHSPEWDLDALTTDVGAVTWVDGTTGLSGVVSPTNSLVGSTTDDLVGNMFSRGITVLENGNYVVASERWDNGAAVDAGAATWGDGNSGVVGAVSTTNSLYGTATDNDVGRGVVGLTNGNYLVRSEQWDNGLLTDVGANTWGDGTTGITGPVSTTNSLHGTNAFDYVGLDIVPLTNGNYVVRSSSWKFGTESDAGAVTWGDGTTGVTGPVTTSNSLHGTQADDRVGSFGIAALTNGNYVVKSPDWSNGGLLDDVGAATWGDGTTGITGPVTTTNSLHGTQADDAVGRRVTELTNGNYVVGSPEWNLGAILDAGAATWGDGTAGVTGPVTTSNSLHGISTLDQVGSRRRALANGNYTIATPDWNNGAATDAGAVTWGDGRTGTTVGPVSTTNSLYGTTPGDKVGDRDVAILANGNYVVASPEWDNGAVVDVGAVTWADGTTGITGPVTTVNSLHGSTAGDVIGQRVVPLSDGDYVSSNPLWDHGGIVDAGAVTWANGTTGVTGPVTTTNSLHGTVALDQVGNDDDEREPYALDRGDYLVGSAFADAGGPADRGIYTFGNTDGVTGPITASNSIFGTPPGNVWGPSWRSGSQLTTDDAVVINTEQNRVILMQLDRPPVFTSTQPDINVLSPDAGPVPVTFATPTAIDVRTSATVACSPASGAEFPLGTTTVTCTATDTAGLTNTTSFDVTVGAPDLVPLDPARLLDTRSGPGTATVDGVALGDGVVGAGTFVEVQIAGRGGVAADATSVMANLAAVGATGKGFATLHPCTTPPPNASSLNYSAGVNIANATFVKLSATGTACIFSSAAAHYTLDVVGYTPATTSIVPLDPARLLDTRTSPGTMTVDGVGLGGGPVPGGEFVKVRIAGRGGVPTDASAVIANIATIGPAAQGFATSYPCTATPPNASSLNYSAGVNIANATLIKLSPTGDACFFSSQTAHYAVDVVAAVPAGSDVVALDPARLLDTRTGPGIETIDGDALGAGPVGAGTFVEVQVTGRGAVPNDATSVVANLAAVGPTGKGFATLYPCTATPPNASSLNYSAGVNIANATLVKLSPAGTACIFSSATAHYALDIVAAVG